MRGLAVQIVYPADQLRHFHRLDIQVVDETGLPASYQDTVQLQILAGVDLLVRDKWRHINEITGLGFGDEFEPIAPAQSCDAVDNIDDAFQVAVMMRAGPGLRIYGDRSGPQLRRPGALGRYRRATLHAQRL